MDRSEMEKVLERCEFFKGLDGSDIGKIADLCDSGIYEAGEYVFQQGDFGDHLYIIASGHVFLERAMDLGSRKGSVVIGALGQGRVLGCWSTLLGEPHFLMSSATCQKPTTVVFFRGADLREIMLSNANLGFNVMEKFCFLLRDRIQGAYGALEKI